MYWRPQAIVECPPKLWDYSEGRNAVRALASWSTWGYTACLALAIHGSVASDAEKFQTGRDRPVTGVEHNMSLQLSPKVHC